MSSTPTNITIRSARIADASALADLATQLGYPADAEALRRRLLAVRERQIGDVFVAVNGDGCVIGWAHAVPRFILEDDEYGELGGLIVDESARGLGVGLALLRAAEAWARAQGFRVFKVRSNVLRTRAHRFYLREGYVEKKRQVAFEKRLD